MLYTALKEQAKLFQLEIKKEMPAAQQGRTWKDAKVYKENNLFQYLNGKNSFHWCWEHRLNNYSFIIKNKFKLFDNLTPVKVK